MSRPDGMQLFRADIQRRIDRIQRATCSTVRLESAARGEFTLVASWPATRAAAAGECRVVFTRLRVLGRTANAHPLKQRMQKKTCRVADEVIREIQRARGL